MDNKIKLFFAGIIKNAWSTSWQRYDILKSKDLDVMAFANDKYYNVNFLVTKFQKIFFNEFTTKGNIYKYNSDLMKKILEFKPNIVWFEWPLLLKRATMEKLKMELPQSLFISFQDDNPFGPKSESEKWKWKYFIDTLDLYDLNFVKRESDIVEYKRRGAKQTELFMHGYFGKFFYPFENVCKKFNVSFIGTALDNRIIYIEKLLKSLRKDLKVFGNRWDRHLFYYLFKNNFNKAVYAQEYAKVVSQSKISLGFVSSLNKDEYSCRTFEIPACRGFFLAERTPKHLDLYEEGKEAEYFSSVEECLDKINFYKKNDSIREKIAGKGHHRCISSYSLNDRIGEALIKINKLL